MNHNQIIIALIVICVIVCAHLAVYITVIAINNLIQAVISLIKYIKRKQ